MNLMELYLASGEGCIESQQFGSKVFMDGGNEVDKYEVGSDLNLIASTGGSCTY